MKKLMEAIERLMFGATAEERVDLMTELVTRRVEERLIATLDRAFDGAIADVFGSDAVQSSDRSAAHGHEEETAE